MMCWTSLVGCRVSSLSTARVQPSRAVSTQEAKFRKVSTNLDSLPAFAGMTQMRQCRAQEFPGQHTSLARRSHAN
jgi:hypothetical protein